MKLRPVSRNLPVVWCPKGRVSRAVVCLAPKPKFFVGGNWKSNGSKEMVSSLVAGLNAGSLPTDIDVVVAPPYLYLHTVKETLKPKYQIAAQNCSLRKQGAFTGEITADMLKDFSIPWVILGHSERRSLFAEDNDTVGAKCKIALEAGLSIVPCIGETLEQRNGGVLWDILGAQTQAIVDNISDWSRVVIAYEPVWAIGTGVVATPDQAEEAHAFLRTFLTEKLGAATANSIRLIYGGSVNDSNCGELASKPNINGFLVGGASLKAPAFVTIANASKLQSVS